MKLTKKSFNLLIFTIYIISFFTSASSYFSISLIDNIRRNFAVILPGIFCILLIYENRRNLKVLLKNKIPLILYCLTIIWFLLSFIFGIKSGLESFKGFINFSVLMTFILMIFNCDLTEEEKKKIKKHLFISFLIVMILGVFQYIFKINLNTYNNAKYPGIFGRIHSTFFIATLLDKYVVLMFPLITYELLKDKDNKFYKILLIFAMLGITFTFSRSGGLIFLVMSFIFFIVTLLKKQFKNSILMVVLICIMILIPGAKYSVQSALDYAYDTVHMPKVLRLDFVKLLSNGKEPIIKDVEAGKCADLDCVGDEEGSKFFRDYYKSIGMEFLKENPVFGIGVGNYYYLYINQNAKDYLQNDSIISDEYPYMYPHNGFIQLMAETGYIGLVLFISYILSFAVLKLKKDDKDNLNFYVILMILFGLSIANITECMFHSKQIIYLFAIMYGVYSNLQNEEKVVNSKKKRLKKQN